MKNIKGFAAALRHRPSPASATRSAGSTLKRLADQARQAVRKYLPTGHGAPGQNKGAVSPQNPFAKLKADRLRNMANNQALYGFNETEAPGLERIEAMRKDLAEQAKKSRGLSS